MLQLVWNQNWGDDSICSPSVQTIPKEQVSESFGIKFVQASRVIKDIESAPKDTKTERIQEQVNKRVFCETRNREREHRVGQKRYIFIMITLPFYTE